MKKTKKITYSLMLCGSLLFFASCAKIINDAKQQVRNEDEQTAREAARGAVKEKLDSGEFKKN